MIAFPTPCRSRAVWLVAAIAWLSTTDVASPAELPDGFAARITQTDVSVAVPFSHAAFALEPGESIHPEVREFGFTAVFRGVVAIATAGRYRFGVEAEGGDASLSVRQPGGAELARAATDRRRASAYCAFVDLAAGSVEVVVEYKRAARGAARLRTLWEMQPSETGGFRAEPIPSSSVRVPPDEVDAVTAGLRDREGRVLLFTKGCTNCHDDGGALGRREGPRLGRDAAHVSAGWIESWIADPSSVREHPDMPRLFTAEEMTVARDLAYYLGQAGKSSPKRTTLNPGLINRGRELFHTVGCIACHGALESAATILSDPQLPADVPSDAPVRAFGDLRGKWTQAGLAAFLRDPPAAYPDGRMPSMNLDGNEAEALAAYLVDHFGGAQLDSTGDAEAGRVAFQERSCASCHATETTTLAAPAATPLSALTATAGCLAADDDASPRYDLTDEQRALLARGIAAVKRASGMSAPIDRAAHTLAAQNCTACHAMDGAGGPADDLRVYFVALDDRVDLGDEGRIPPNLSGVGSKLNRDWLHRVLVDRGRARPYMGARMPQFGEEQVTGLADQLARREGVIPNSDLPEPQSTDELTQIGRQLAGQSAMNCISCHQFKDYPPAGTPGPYINQFAERLRYEWWRSYVQAPARFKPGTRMPAFSIGRQSHFNDILGGDIYRQGDALWCYFNLGEMMPTPIGLEAASAMQIDVGNEPVILRTFLKNTGPRGIAVGLPEGVHYAFDAGAVRLVEAWQGEFLDASGAWAGRGGSVAGELGRRVWTAPDGDALHLGTKPDSWPEVTGRDARHRFRGYRLDAKGYPTFLYDIEALHVEEKITTRLAPTLGIRREFTVDGAFEELWLNTGRDGGRLGETVGVTITPHLHEDQVWFAIKPISGAQQGRFVLEVTL